MRRLVRTSHIFGSAVREILESRYLEAASEQPITMAQFHLLKLIGTNGRHRVGELAQLLGTSGPAASKNIDRLERLGLVARMTSDEDRRATLLSCDPKGRDLVRRYEAVKRRRLAPVLAKLQPEEIDRLAELLERFAVLLFEHERPSERFCLRCAGHYQTSCPIGETLGHCSYEAIRSGRHGRKPILKENVS